MGVHVFTWDLKHRHVVLSLLAPKRDERKVGTYVGQGMFGGRAWTVRVCGGQNCNMRRDEAGRSHAQPSIRTPHLRFSPYLANCHHTLSSSAQRTLERPEQRHISKKILVIINQSVPHKETLLFSHLQLWYLLDLSFVVGDMGHGVSQPPRRWAWVGIIMSS